MTVILQSCYKHLTELPNPLSNPQKERVLLSAAPSQSQAT